MKRNGILNSHISKVLADLGHTDYIVIADIGLPIPDHVKKIDLAIQLGIPSFSDVVKAVSEDMVIEKVVVAKELANENEDTSQFISNYFNGLDIEEVPHDIFKSHVQQAKAVIRTGEAKPYANCLLYAGVNFGEQQQQEG